MRKALTTILAVALLVVTMGVFTTTAHAADTTYRVQDKAGLFSTEQEQQLRSMIDQLVGYYNIDLILVTVDSMAEDGYSDIVAYADDMYDYNGYGVGDDDSGMLFVIAMQEREWAISTYGKGIPCYTDKAQSYIMDIVGKYLSDGDYYGAFSMLVSMCGTCMDAYTKGDPYPPKQPYSPATGVAAFIIVGLIVALIYTGILKGQLKSVRFAADAHNYVDQNSIDINVSKDTFLYASVTKRVRETKSSSGSSTHTSSSGRSHGGSHGSF